MRKLPDYYIKGNRHISKYYILFVIVILSFLIRLLFRSNYLDDWDSVQFALAIKHYSIAAHQPHPPGYPIYILFGRIIDIFLNNPTKSLVFLSVFFGSLSIIPTYLLTENFFNKEIAILSSIIISLVPGHMLYSEVAMSDIVSLFFVTMTVYLLYLGIGSKKYLYIGSFILGITAGIRLTDIILISILFMALICRKNLKESMFSIISTIMGISIWLIPIIMNTGFDTLLRVENAQYNSNYNTRIISLERSNIFESLINLFVDGWSHIFFIFILIMLIFIILKISKIKNKKEILNYLSDKRMLFILIWLVTYLSYSTLFNALIHSRYLLPQYVPLSIIFSYSIIKMLDLINKKLVKMSLSILFTMLIILMGEHAIAGAYAIHTTIPAPVQAANFIKENYNAQNTIIIGTCCGSFRHFQYYLPNFTVKSDARVSSDNIYDYIIENKTIISEFPFTINPPSIYISSYIRNSNIYPKHEIVKLYENRPRKEFLMMINEGWYHVENLTGIPFVWMSNDGMFRLDSDKDNNISINFQTLSFYRSRILEVLNANNVTIYRTNIEKNRLSNMTILINLKKGNNIIRFHIIDGCERPSDFPELKNTDNRCLSITVQNIILDKKSDNKGVP